MSTPDGHYQLLFEGLKEESADVLRQVKVIFLGDLDLSVDEAQSILLNTPHILRSGADRKELEGFRKKLEAAGARVTIVAPQSSAGATESYDFTFELGELATTDETGVPKEPKVYELPVDALEELPPEPAPAEETIPSLNDLNQSLDAIQSVLAADAEATIRVLDTTSELPATPEPPELGSLDFASPSSSPSPVNDTGASPPSTPLATGLEFDEATSAPSPIPPTPATAAPATAAPSAPTSSNLSFDALEPLPAEEIPEHKPIIPPEEEWDEDLTPRAILQPHTPTIPPSILTSSAEAESKGDPPHAAAPQPTPPAPLLAQVAESSSALAPPEAHSPAPSTPAPLRNETAISPAALSEQTDESVAPPAPKTKKRAAKGDLSSRLPSWLPLDIVAPIAIGLLVLAVGNMWWSATNSKELRKEDVLAGLPDKGVRNGGAGKGANVATEPSVAPKGVVTTFAGVSRFENLTVGVELLSDNSRLFSRVLAGAMDAPPELTDEEIVAKKVQPPRISKFEISDVLFEPQSPGLFAGLGNVKLYVDYAGNRSRLVSKARLKAQLAPDNSMATLAIEVNEGLSGELPPGATIEPRPNNLYAFGLSIQISVAARPESTDSSSSSASSISAGENEGNISATGMNMKTVPSDTLPRAP